MNTLSRVQEGSLRVPAAVEQRCAGFGAFVRDDLLKAATAAARGQAWKEVGFPLRRVGPFAGSDAAVHLERARLLIARDRTAEGAQALDAAGAGGGHEVARLHAELALRAGDPGEALRRYEALAAADPVGPEGRGARVWIHLLRGESAAARTAGDGQLLPSGRLGLALALEQAGEWELAAKELQAVFDADGATDSRAVALSFVYVVRAVEDQVRELGQLLGQERALAQVADHALLRAYDQASTRELAAEGLLAVDDPGAPLLIVAGELLERARTQQPGRASTHVLRARHALLAQRGRDEVLAEWRRARELSRGLPVPAVDKARFDARFGATDVEALLPR